MVDEELLNIDEEPDVFLGDLQPTNNHHTEDTDTDDQNENDQDADDRHSERSCSAIVELTSMDIVRSFPTHVSKVNEDAGLGYMKDEYTRYSKKCTRALCTPYGQQPRLIWFPQEFR
jgi:hypothetical protein